MRILHVTQNYHPSVGGTQHTLKKISEIFTEDYKDEVTVLTSNSLYGPNRQKFEKISPQQEVINGVLVKRFSFLKIHKSVIKLIARALKRFFKMPLPGFLYALLSGPVSPAMFKAMATSKADVIGASSVHYLFCWYPAWRKYTKHPKPFVLYGAPHLYNTQLSTLYKKRIQAADYYIANTRFEKDYLVNLGFKENKIMVVGAGSDILSKADFTITDEALIAKYEMTEDTIVITFIGRQEALKGIPVLIKAFSQLREKYKNVILFVCGAAGSYTAELQKLVTSGERIRLFTNITDLKKTEILRITDILVLPSTEESFGVVFLEAWSFGKPVIGAGIGAVASLIEDGSDGLLFEPDNHNNLADKLEILLNDEFLRKEMGMKGYKKFQENFTWDVIAKKFRDVYALAILDGQLQKTI